MSKTYNRELSWLLFNDRVMQEANDRSVPLVQRLRFLGIFSNNQDEFIRVRLANMVRLAELKYKSQPKLSGGLTASELVPLIDSHIESSRAIFLSSFSDIIEEMEREGICVVDDRQLSEAQLEFCRQYFSSVVSVRLVPLILRKSIDTPLLPDGKIYLAVKMAGPRRTRYAIVQIPVSRDCPRFVVLPSDGRQTHVIFLDDIIRLFLDDIFFMFTYDSISAHTFKVVRDAEMELGDDVLKSMSEKMTRGIHHREQGRPVRLIYDSSMPVDVLQILSQKMGTRSAGQLEAGGRYHQMRDLVKFPSVRPDLEESKAEPLLHPQIDPFDSIIKVIRKHDILMCYPYHTFNHFIDLLREAAVDPRVHSIQITLYRTAERSKVIHALLSAARNGKNVTALVELKARFDEEKNIDNTDLLQSGGVRVVHSLEELKIHSKLLLIERMEGSSMKGYVYVGTGNFNEDTARIYGDFGLMTADEQAVEDARNLFDFLHNTHKHPEYKRLVVSPYYMRDKIESIIDGEIKQARKGKKAYIYGKFNSLTDEKMVEKLYEASEAGVRVRLIIRGACCLVTGVKGLSENIEVHSIVDKYLEHARLLIAGCGGKPQSWIMSADLMTRNLDRRVEVGIPIRDRQIHATLEDYFDIQWRDNTKARLTAPPFDNRYVERAAGKEVHRSQLELYDYFKADSKSKSR